MARAIATVSGIALVPGVSKNGRLYTRETIARAVARAQERLAAGENLDIVYQPEPITQLTHHAAEDDSTRIVGGLTAMSLDENGAARFDARIADTEHGRTIAVLLDTSDGEPPFLRGSSIRGAWIGKVSKIRGPDGHAVETADDLEIDGLDYTRKPGVTGAGVDTFAWVRGGATETTERVLITESVQEAHVTAITEEAAPESARHAPPEGVLEAVRAVFGGLALAEADTPALSKRDSGLSDDSGRKWADPGYQPDKKQRYDLSTKAKAKAAWSYINQAGNAKAYTDNQLKRIKGRIKSALKKFGVTIAAEGWTVEPAFQVTEAIAEYYGDPDMCGSYSLTASNGPTTVTVCSYGLDPADLQMILAQACGGAGAALCALDPDMDGDIDVPGADAEDTDDDADDLASRLAAALRGESAETLDDLIAEARPIAPVTETSPEDPAPEPVAEPQEDKEVPVVTDTATAVEASPAAAPGSVTLTEAQFAELLARTAAPAPAPAPTAAETAPAPAAVTETDDDRIARIVEERAAARLKAETTTAVAETEEQRIDRLVEARVAAAKQELVASGKVAPGRKGLVTEHTSPVSATGAEMPPAPPGKSWDEMHKWSTEELNQYATPDLATYVFRGKV